MGGEEGRTFEKDTVALLLCYLEACAGGGVPLCDEAR